LTAVSDMKIGETSFVGT